MKFRWGRCLAIFALAGIFLLALAALVIWIKLRGHLVEPVRNEVIVPRRSGPQVMRLWPGRAPGSENWTRQETESDLFGETYVRNVVEPTLTAYFPPPATSNGTAVIICPGGGFHALFIDSEGSEAALYLNTLGVTAFVLKYRLVRTGPAYFFDEFRRFGSPAGMRWLLDTIAPLAEADAAQALRVVRAHAAEWGLAPNRVGVLGFSAGGYLALSLAHQAVSETHPDFLALLYPLTPRDSGAPIARIPLFAACAADDRRVPPALNCQRVYAQWRAAGLPAELHVFSAGGHGFGMTKQNRPSDAWPEIFRQWLLSEGFIQGSSEKPPSP